ncbi:ribonuclease P protein component [Tepidibacter formicigenes]|jgi:ribonuclease P protein component|uniref:Ribonuclease P protein component n=1 Tax=Tepidibacter formicigenes DSM 15518 TaxID=1123349 RepID=A0A1M6P886_9FIRM|nr:ribonuclease P protein component [Tepidibacter formicigenes]SHK04135.1 ribonuclease P protein component [Tepidibacter formicigenes DSM 15518]
MNFVNAQGIKKDSEFRHVYKQGKSFANRLLVMYILKNDLDINRVGFSVSKKVGISVVRNHVKRLIKESFRLISKDDKVKTGYDIVFISRVAAKDSDFNSIQKSMINLFKKANIIKR